MWSQHAEAGNSTGNTCGEIRIQIVEAYLHLKLADSRVQDLEVTGWVAVYAELLRARQAVPIQFAASLVHDPGDLTAAAVGAGSLGVPTNAQRQRSPERGMLGDRAGRSGESPRGRSSERGRATRVDSHHTYDVAATDRNYTAVGEASRGA